MACAARAFYPAPRIAPLALLAGQTLILVGGLTASFVLWQALVAGSSESVVPALSLIACLLGPYTIAGLLTLAARVAMPQPEMAGIGRTTARGKGFTYG